MPPFSLFSLHYFFPYSIYLSCNRCIPTSPLPRVGEGGWGLGSKFMVSSRISWKSINISVESRWPSFRGGHFCPPINLFLDF